MTAALAVVTTSGLEDGVPRSRGEGTGEVVVERGPGAAYHMFVVMEDLVEKLKLLRYEEEFLRKSNLKAPSRWVPVSPSAWVPASLQGDALLGPAGNQFRESGLAIPCLRLPSQRRALHSKLRGGPWSSRSPDLVFL